MTDPYRENINDKKTSKPISLDDFYKDFGKDKNAKLEVAKKLCNEYYFEKFNQELKAASSKKWTYFSITLLSNSNNTNIILDEHVKYVDEIAEILSKEYSKNGFSVEIKNDIKELVSSGSIKLIFLTNRKEGKKYELFNDISSIIYFISLIFIAIIIVIGLIIGRC